MALRCAGPTGPDRREAFRGFGSAALTCQKGRIESLGKLDGGFSENRLSMAIPNSSGLYGYPPGDLTVCELENQHAIKR